MKSIKRMLYAVVFLSLAFFLILTAAAEEEGTDSSIITGNAGSAGENVTWELDLESGTMTLTPHEMGNVTGKMKNYTCYTDTPARWHAYRSLIKSVVVEEGVINIGDYAFFDCSLLESITLPSTVKTIGKGAFSRCSSLKRIIIPTGVTSIGEAAFFACSSLTSFEVADGNIDFVTEGGILYNKNKTVLIAAPVAVKSVALPTTLQTISPYAFSSCRLLETVMIPDSVTIIGREAFSNCAALKSIILPSSLKRIESGSFSHCRSLAVVTLPIELTTLASDAFWNCPSLSSLSISEENSFFSVKDGVLYNRAKTKLLLSPAALRSVTLTTGVKEIAPNAFMGSTGLESLTLSPTLETIGYGAFYGCSSLKTLWMPNAAVSIEVGARAFALCDSLTDGDGNGDGETNVLDLLALAGMIRRNDVTLMQIAVLDADGDGRLDVNDLIEWVKAIGTGCRS